jgi:SAM-dependent methyltransferase
MRLIAFYLPQYHEIPENNTFWGEGFTEWTNVKKAKPISKKHAQPRLPTELGFYDLTDDSVRHKQAQLARQYGIDAWCYYYYRFNGKRLLEMPLDRHIQDKSLDMPFLICWANENWTRTWDGLDREVLIKQEHGLEDDLNFIKEVAPMLADPRYVKIENKPVLLIYRPELWTNIKQTVSIWRNYMRENYNLEIYLIRPIAFDQCINPTNPENIGFDAAYQFPPFETETQHFNKPGFYGNLGDYEKCKCMALKEYGFKVFRGVMTGFDNTPRRRNNNTGIYVNNSPVSYGEWLQEAIKYTAKNFKKQEQLVFINAWNEWGEGAILEPCDQWGRKFLITTLASLLHHNIAKAINDENIMWHGYNVNEFILQEGFKRELTTKIPPDDLRFSVINDVSSEFFRASGKDVYLDFTLILHKYFSKNWFDFKKILDFGCGCGRICRFLPSKALSCLHGIDTTKKAIEWCGNNLIGSYQSIEPQIVKTPFIDQYFDLIYSFSVFSHLKIEHMKSWLKELHRITSPGGILLISAHFSWMHCLINEGERKEVIKNGYYEKEYVDGCNGGKEEYKPLVNSFFDNNYYVNSFITEDFFWNLCKDYFELITITSGSSNIENKRDSWMLDIPARPTGQGIAVLRKIEKI